MINLKVIYGMLKHDALAYVEAYKTACQWSKNHPEIDPTDFAALQDKAWDELAESLGDAGVTFTSLKPEEAN